MVLGLYTKLQDTLDKRDPESDLWSGALGIHGLDECNQASEEFLDVCATNQLTIMNTWFKKKL